MTYPVLYILIRTDLPSLKTGKSEAQASHIANRFVFENHIAFARKDVMEPLPENTLVTQWVNECQGFGTAIVLGASKEEIHKFTAWDSDMAIDDVSAIVFDPTYPYTVDLEIFPLIDEKFHTSEPVINGNRVHLTRNEMVGGYIFGRKGEVNMPGFDKLPLLNSDLLNKK